MIGIVSIFIRFEEERFFRMFTDSFFTSLFWMSSVLLLILFFNKQRNSTDLSRLNPTRKGRKIYNADNRRVIFEAQEVVAGINRLGAGFPKQNVVNHTASRTNNLV